MVVIKLCVYESCWRETDHALSISRLLVILEYLVLIGYDADFNFGWARRNWRRSFGSRHNAIFSTISVGSVARVGCGICVKVSSVL